MIFPNILLRATCSEKKDGVPFQVLAPFPFHKGQEPPQNPSNLDLNPVITLRKISLERLHHKF